MQRFQLNQLYASARRSLATTQSSTLHLMNAYHASFSIGRTYACTWALTERTKTTVPIFPPPLSLITCAAPQSPPPPQPPTPPWQDLSLWVTAKVCFPEAFIIVWRLAPVSSVSGPAAAKVLYDTASGLNQARDGGRNEKRMMKREGEVGLIMRQTELEQWGGRKSRVLFLHGKRPCPLCRGVVWQTYCRWWGRCCRCRSAADRRQLPWCCSGSPHPCPDLSGSGSRTTQTSSAGFLTPGLSQSSCAKKKKKNRATN